MSPALSWSNAPSGTKSFVLICRDLDADRFVHWVVYDIPASVSSLPEGIPAQASIENGAKQGRNAAETIGYFGPEPPPGSGEHRYEFKLYALSVETLGLEPGEPAARVEETLSSLRQQGNILGEVSLTGKFSR